jgi:hypothetical protein
MTPKEKAIELFNKMYLVDDPMGNYPMCFDTAKQCALIAIDETQKQLSKSIEDFKNNTQIVSCFATAEAFNENLIYTRKENELYLVQQIIWWDLVQQEILNL